MGKLLMISLIWTWFALLFQPALMGPPPKDSQPADRWGALVKKAGAVEPEPA